MKPSEALNKYRDEIRRIITSHEASNPRVFGSVQRGEDNVDSDLDVLIDPGSAMTLFDIGAIRLEILELTGLEANIITPDSLPDELCKAIIAEAQPI